LLFDITFSLIGYIRCVGRIENDGLFVSLFIPLEASTDVLRDESILLFARLLLVIEILSREDSSFPLLLVNTLLEDT